MKLMIGLLQLLLTTISMFVDFVVGAYCAIALAWGVTVSGYDDLSFNVIYDVVLKCNEQLLEQ